MFGLVLEGGGAKGAYQIGAWKALRELNIDIGGVAGTSVGALNGAMILQGDFEKAWNIWYDISFDKIINNIDEKEIEAIRNKEVRPENLIFAVKKLRELFSERGLDITPLRKLISENVSEDKIRSSGKDFGIVTVELTDLKPVEIYIEDIPYGKLADYLLASANLPIFKMEKIDGKLFIDGGVFDNLPVGLLAAKGYKDIIVIRLHGLGRVRGVNRKKLNLIVIEPSEDLGGLLDFSAERARANLQLGYYDTLKVINKYSGTHYYIKESYPEDYYARFFFNMNPRTVSQLAEIIGLNEKIPCYRLLFEKVIPRIADILDLGSKATYKDIIIDILERAARTAEIEKFRIYKFEEFLQTVLSRHQKSSQGISNKIPRILRKSDLVLKTVKDQLLPEIVDVFIEELKLQLKNNA